MKPRYRNIRAGASYNPFQALSPVGLGTETQYDQFQEAIVVDSIINNDHELYSPDGYNVGAVRFRPLTDGNFKDESVLSWAYPLHPNQTQYPLVGEIVYVFQSMTRFWYIATFNVSNRVTAQDLKELLTETKTPDTGPARTDTIRSGQAAPYTVSVPPTTNVVGSYFQDLANVYRLKHIEGDIIYEGRSGQSIRFGSAWKSGKVNSLTGIPFPSSVDQSPNMLIRVGPPVNGATSVNSTFATTIEDIDRDSTSLWMVSDQLVPLTPATLNDKIHGISVPDIPTEFKGSQLIQNSGQLILNAKASKLMGFSKTGIHWTTMGNITMDATGDHITWTNGNRTDRVVNKWTLTTGDLDISSTSNILMASGQNQTISAKGQISIVSNRVVIGSESGTAEPLVLGDALKRLLTDLLDALGSPGIIVDATNTTGGPSAVSAAYTAKFSRLRTQLESILSNDNFTVKSNDAGRDVRSISSYRES
jgi:hypothetical protein